MGKLHEILAVEGDLEGAYKRILQEIETVFKKGEYFLGMHRTLKMFDDARQQEADAVIEHREATTTVRDRLDYAEEVVVRYLDCVLQKESTNQAARADLVVDGKVLAQQLPATFLLGLETKLKVIRTIYDAIPTLKPGIKWEKDITMANIYVAAQDIKAFKTEKTIGYKILVPATDKHPAQVEKWTQDIPVGIFTQREWSGMLSPREKHELLARVDRLVRACKEARQRANCTEVSDEHVGKLLYDYIDGRFEPALS